MVRERWSSPLLVRRIPLPHRPPQCDGRMALEQTREVHPAPLCSTRILSARAGLNEVCQHNHLPGSSHVNLLKLVRNSTGIFRERVLEVPPAGKDGDSPVPLYSGNINKQYKLALFPGRFGALAPQRLAGSCSSMRFVQLEGFMSTSQASKTSWARFSRQRSALAQTILNHRCSSI